MPSPKIQAHLDRATTMMLRLLLVGLVVTNVAFLIPGIYYSIKVGDLLPTAIMILVSFVVWGIGYAGVGLSRAARRVQKRGHI